MKVVHQRAALVEALDSARAEGRSVGLVLTMGALHAGHRSLVVRAAAECDVVAVTVFVNPLQFDDGSDLAAYPRTLADDTAMAEAAGASYLFAPSVAEMYPNYPLPPSTTVHVGGAAARLEGASRPGHFDGVATVVVKLLALAGRCRAYFGEKDFQQLVVVRRLVADLFLPVDVVGCPTWREVDGVAMSSRNVRLSGEQRTAAPVLFRSLSRGADLVKLGERHPDAIRRAVLDELHSEPLVDVDYVEAVDADTLDVPDVLSGPARLLVAARLGDVRLIDNVELVVAPSPDMDLLPAASRSLDPERVGPRTLVSSSYRPFSVEDPGPHPFSAPEGAHR